MNVVHYLNMEVVCMTFMCTNNTNRHTTSMITQYEYAYNIHVSTMHMTSMFKTIQVDE
jgi:hypothetical protein